MSISRTNTYLVLNYGTSPIGVSTKHDSFLIPGASNGSPSYLPLSIDEIAVINSNSSVFRTGALRFEPEYQQDIYEELRIADWESIKTNEEIEQMLLNPSVEDLQQLIDNESPAYFERVRGIFMGLKNAGYDLSSKVSQIMDLRYKEFVKNKRKSNIQLTQSEVKSHSDTEVDKLKAQIASMQEMIDKMQAMMSAAMPAPQPAEQPQLDDQQHKPKQPSARKSRSSSGQAK